MGGKSGSDPSMAPAASAEDFDYLNRYPDVAESGLNPYYHYQKWGQAEGRTYGSAPMLPEFDFGAIFEALAGQQEAAYGRQEELAAQYASQQEKALKEAEQMQGLASLDQVFGTKLDAANKAIADVNTQINDEAAHASVKGIDFAVTEEEKQARINNMFADYWSESSEAQFADLYGKWGAGNTAYDWTLPVTRGTGTDTEGALPKEGKKVGGPVKGGATVLTEEDEESSKTLLGA